MPPHHCLLSLTLAVASLGIPRTAIAQDTTTDAPAAQQSPADTARRQRALNRIKKTKPAPNTTPATQTPSQLPPLDPARLAKFDQLTNALADPSMGGRFPGTPGIEHAAQLIETEFQTLDLLPLFPNASAKSNAPNKSFRQPLELGEDLAILSGSLSVQEQENDRPALALLRGSTHAVVPYSGTGTVTGPLVFCGYAITAGPGDYMNFPVNANFEGKIAVVLTNEPMDHRGQSLWSNTGWSINAALTAKISAVTRRGAEAVLVVRPPVLDDDSFMTQESIKHPGRFDEIPILMLSTPLAQTLLSRADPKGRSLDQLIALSNAGPTVLDLDTITVTVSAEVTRTPNLTYNLGALLPGRGSLAREYIVIGAHYDHVGQGTIGSNTPGRLHPGADDNASGTAAMLLAAQSLAGSYADFTETDSARSIIFLAFTAEESGLKGSIRYVIHPPVPLADHTLMLNLDMIGRMRNNLLELGGINSAGGLEELIAPHLDRSGLRIQRGTSVGDNRSDHASFDRKKIPNLFFFTGLHDDYHTPADTPDLLNDGGAVRVANLVASIALDAATLEPRLTHREARRETGTPTTPRVRVGIIPAPHSDGGLSVRKVSPNTSASRAGLLQYDRITHWNGEPLTLDRFAKLLLQHNPGDTVTLTVIRDEEEIEIEMTLNAPG